MNKVHNNIIQITIALPSLCDMPKSLRASASERDLVPERASEGVGEKESARKCVQTRV
jgi:hypothetical protein